MDGRRRLLYKDVFSYFDQDIELYYDIKKWVKEFENNEIIIKKIMFDNDTSISGECDMLDITNKTLIDFKCSISECKLEWIIQLFVYVALLRLQYGYDIDKIKIYNPMSGTTAVVDLGDWKHEKALLEYLDKVRNTKILRTKTKTENNAQKMPTKYLFN